MIIEQDNPYAAPLTLSQPAEVDPASFAWRNRLGSIAFLLAMLFPIVALVSLGALLMEDDFGVVRWRVHRVIRLVLFRSSGASLGAVCVGVAALAQSPRRLAFYGLLIGTLGSTYWALAMMGILRR